MKKTLLLVLFIFSILSLNAQSRSYKQAIDIARSQAKKLGISTSDIIESTTRAQDSFDHSYYPVSLGNNKGFVLVSRDTRLPEVLGYSLSGNFDYEKIPTALKEFLRAFDANMSVVNIDYSSIVPNRRVLTRASNVVEPLIKTNWGQGTPFNNYAPDFDSSRKCAAGCVAIAMSQVLNYYKFPLQVASDLPDYIAVNGQSYPGVAQGGPYDWDNILDTYQNSYTDAQADAVAKLVHDCGVSVKSDYGWETGADCVNLKYAFSTYFNMDPDFYAMIGRGLFTADQWFELLTNELVSGRPVIYSGSTSKNAYTGHCFICDGVDADGNFHINWGWDGSYNGYFNITILNPYNSNPDEGYIYDVFAYIGIAPDNGIQDEPLVEYRPIKLCAWNDTDLNLFINNSHRDEPNGKFSGYLYPHISNEGDAEVEFKLTVGLMDENGQPVRIGDNGLHFKTNPGSIWEGTCWFSYALPVGTYRLYILISYDDEQTWDFIPGTEEFPITVKVTASDLYELPRNPGQIIPGHKECDELDLYALNYILLDKANNEKLNTIGGDINWDGSVDGIDYVYASNLLYGKDVSKPEVDYFARIGITSANTETNGSGVINFSLNSYGYEVTYVQFDLSLPNGFKIKKGYNGRYVIKLNKERLVYDETFDIYDDHQIFIKDFGGGYYRIIVSSISSTPFLETTGDLFSIKIESTESESAGDYPFTLENICVVSPNAGGITNLRMEANINVSGELSIKSVVSDSKSTFYSVAGNIMTEKPQGIPYIEKKQSNSTVVKILK